MLFRSNKGSGLGGGIDETNKGHDSISKRLSEMAEEFGDFFSLYLNSNENEPTKHSNSLK